MTEPGADEGQPPRPWALLTTAALTLPLLLAFPPLVALGRKARPASDDWCLRPLAVHHGFTGVVSNIYRDQNGRFFNAVVNGVAFSTYGFSGKALPGIVLLLMLGLLAWAVALLAQRGLGARRGPGALAGVTLAAAIVLALLVGKPAEYQTLYHVPTIISHTLTIVIALATGLAVVLLQRRSTVAAAIAGGLCAVVLGTFNEAFTGVGLVTVAALLVLHRMRVPLPVRPPVTAALGAGLVVGFLTVYFSPGSQNRQQLIRSHRLLSRHVLSETAHNWAHVVHGTVRTPSFTLLVCAGALVGGLLLRARPGRGRDAVLRLAVPAVWAVLASGAACFVLTYSFNGRLVLRERTWPSMTISLLLLTAWLSVLAGSAVADQVTRLPVQRRRGLTVALLGAVLAVAGVRGISAAHQVRHLEHVVALRATAFDASDRDVRSQVSQGASPVYVRPAPIDGLYEPFFPHRRAGFPSNCLPAYYGKADYQPYPEAGAP